MAECSHDCSNCKKDCADREKTPDFRAPLNAASKVGKVIAVASGKGGVGKSFVTSMLAVLSARKGRRVAILDADITGPSIPKAFNLACGAYQDERGILPPCSNMGIKVMSLNLLVKDPAEPVVWRGPVIAGAVKQFWTDVCWEDVDVMFVDMPPGTGDVPLTVFQSLPVDGVVVVASPQELVGLIVEKSVKMAEMMDKKVLGLVENMSYFTCPDCGARHDIFGKSHIDEIAARHGIGTVCRLPIDPGFASAMDAGAVETVECTGLETLVEQILKS